MARRLDMFHDLCTYARTRACTYLIATGSALLDTLRIFCALPLRQKVSAALNDRFDVKTAHPPILDINKTLKRSVQTRSDPALTHTYHMLFPSTSTSDVVALSQPKLTPPPSLLPPLCALLLAQGLTIQAIHIRLGQADR